MTPVASARRLVVKVGSSLVTNDGRGLDGAAVAAWAAQIAELKHASKRLEKEIKAETEALDAAAASSG